MDTLPRLFQELQAHARHISAEELETFGKTAAKGWSDHRYDTLGEAVVGVVKTAGLSPEQVFRVVEFANTNAFLQEFRQKTATPNGNGYVDFGPGALADPAAVLRDLNDGGGGAPGDDSDYAMPPEKTAGELTLEQLFEGAAEEEVSPDAHNAVLSIRDKLAGALSQVAAEHAQFESLYLDLARELTDQVKTAMLSDGVSAGDIVRAWSLSGVCTPSVKLAFQELRKTGRMPQADLEASLHKTGSARVVNPAHPVVTRMMDFELVLDKLGELHEDLRTLTTGLGVWDGLRSKLGAEKLYKFAAASGVAAKAAKKALVPAVVDLADAASGPAANAAHAITSRLVSPESAKAVSKAVGTATRFAPHGAAATVGGLGAYNVGHAALNNPYLQYGASFVPGTPQERMRRQERIYQGAQTAQGLGIPYMPVGA